MLLSLFNIIIPIPDSNHGALISTFCCYKNIVIKSADKCSAVGVWDRDDYIKEAEEQLGDKDICGEVFNDPGPLISNIHDIPDDECLSALSK